MKEKDRDHFGTVETTRGPLENLFRRVDFKPLVFGTFGEMSYPTSRRWLTWRWSTG
jgi:hypothetical protein